MWWPWAEALRAKEAQDPHAQGLRTPQVTGCPRCAGTRPAGPSSGSHVPITVPGAPLPLQGEAEAMGGPGTCHQGLRASTALRRLVVLEAGGQQRPVTPDPDARRPGGWASGGAEERARFKLQLCRPLPQPSQ